MPVLALTDPRPPARSLILTEPVRAVQPPLPDAVECWDHVSATLSRAEVTAVARIVRLLLETLAGIRPLSRCDAFVSRDVMRVLARGARERRVLRGRTLRTSLPTPGVIEVSLRVTDAAAGRDAAIAVRLERAGASLICTAFDLGPRRGMG